MEAFLALIAFGIIVLIARYNCDKVESLLESLLEKVFGRLVQDMNIYELQSSIQTKMFCLQCAMVIFDLVGIVGFIRAINNGSYDFGVIILAIEVAPKLLEPQYQKYFSPTIVKSAKIVTALYFNEPISTLTNAGLLVLSLLSTFLVKKASRVLLNVGILTIINNTNDEILDLINNANVNEDLLQTIVDAKVTEITDFAGSCCEDLNPCKIAIALCGSTVSIINAIKQTINNFYQDANNWSGYLYACKVTGTIASYLFFLHHSIHIIPPYVIVAVLVKFAVILIEPVTSVKLAMDNGFAVINKKCDEYKRTIQLANLSIRGTIQLVNLAIRGARGVSQWIST